MSYKLTVLESGEVEIVKPAGSSFVRTKIPEGKAIGIIESSDKAEKSDKFEGFEICVNEGKYYIAGTFTEEEKFEDKPKDDTFKKSDNKKENNG